MLIVSNALSLQKPTAKGSNLSEKNHDGFAFIPSVPVGTTS